MLLPDTCMARDLVDFDSDMCEHFVVIFISAAMMHPE